MNSFDVSLVIEQLEKIKLFPDLAGSPGMVFNTDPINPSASLQPMVPSESMPSLKYELIISTLSHFDLALHCRAPVAQSVAKHAVNPGVMS